MSSSPRVPTFGRSLMQAAIALLGAMALGIAACASAGGDASSQARATVLDAALDSPSGLAFLPDGRMLVTEKSGAVAVVSPDGNNVLSRLSVPADGGLGGLLDVALDPNFASTRWVFLAFAESVAGGTGTALARAQLNADADGWSQAPQIIWRQSPGPTTDTHYGARIAFRGDGTLHLAVGERGLELGDNLGSGPNRNRIVRLSP